jgi:hypothetical protein
MLNGVILIRSNCKRLQFFLNLFSIGLLLLDEGLRFDELSMDGLLLMLLREISIISFLDEDVFMIIFLNIKI